MTYRTCVKIHGYMAVFFLPLAVLYALTGAAYIAGHAGAAPQTVFSVTLAAGWPDDLVDARTFVDDALSDKSLPVTDDAADARRLNGGTYSWRSLPHNVTLTRIDEAGAQITFQEHGLFRRLVEIHKNHAGPVFSVLGFAFGLAMLGLVLSGSIMMFRSRLYRRTATIMVACGAAVSTAAYFVSV